MIIYTCGVKCCLPSVRKMEEVAVWRPLVEDVAMGWGITYEGSTSC